MSSTAPAAGSSASAVTGSAPEGYSFFTTPEQQFIEAAIERLIPTDDLGPGARDSGVSFYIDQQLRSEYGQGGRMYLTGPYAPGTPTQGYQLGLPPAEVYRIGIREADRWCEQKYGSAKTFANLTAAQQDDVLGALDKGTAGGPMVPGKAFFSLLLAATIEGYFSDPIYGGNRNMAGWKLVGFPGAASDWRGQVTQHNKEFTPTPMGIADLQAQMRQASGQTSMRPSLRQLTAEELAPMES